MGYISQIRKLARSSFWQNIYSASKDVGSIKLFDNDGNYSGLQAIFLYWLKVYDLLFSELAQKEWRYLTEDVILDNDRTDAFLYWRSQQRSAEIDKYKNDQKINNMKFKNPGKTSSFNVDFS